MLFCMQSTLLGTVIILLDLEGGEGTVSILSLCQMSPSPLTFPYKACLPSS